jgi:hypothetical protein
MAVRAKFRVHQAKRNDWGTEVVMHPVYSGSEENKKFWDATPNGQIQMTIKNEVAAEQFQADKEYYVDFTAAPTPVEPS